MNGIKEETHFMGLVFLIGSIFAAAIDDEPPVQENDIKTSPKHRFGSNPDCDESGWFILNKIKY